MRSKFDEQLEQLHTELIKMGALCETAIATAVMGLKTGDPEHFQRAISIEYEIDEREREIENLCLKLLLQQQPVAGDLRRISSALKMITDMERIGDQASDISEIAMLGNVSSSEGIRPILLMAEAAIKMVTDSVDAYVKQDLELAKAVIVYDDVVDSLFDEVKLGIIELAAASKHNSELAVDLLMIAKYFERIGDHAVNIAEWVVFSITGLHKGEFTL